MKLSRNEIKLLAALLMLCNHAAAIFLPPGGALREFLTGIGYFTAVSMCFFLVEGLRRTRSPRRYGQRLLLFALLSQPPYAVALRGLDASPAVFAPGPASWNMLLTLWLCLLMLRALSLPLPRPLRLLPAAVPALLSYFSDWGLLAPSFTALFFHAGCDPQKRARAWLLSCFLIGLDSLSGALLLRLPPRILLLRCLCGLSGPVAAAFCTLFLYDSAKKEGVPEPLGKWFFYLFYPLHLLLLHALRRLL